MYHSIIILAVVRVLMKQRGITYSDAYVLTEFASVPVDKVVSADDVFVKNANAASPTSAVGSTFTVTVLAL